MPSFRLEPPDSKSKITKYLFVAKKSYNSNVYVDGWFEQSCSLPIDTNPFEEGKINHHLSHYKNLGVGECMNFKTTTKEMLKEINQKDSIRTKSQHTSLINLLTFNDSTRCDDDLRHWCKDVCYCYSTTMQDSYRMPYPYAMKRLAMAKTPHLLYRKMQGENALNEDKFMDDGFVQRTDDRIHAKGSQFISYNPLTGLNMDGSLPKGNKIQSCSVLDY